MRPQRDCQHWGRIVFVRSDEIIQVLHTFFDRVCLAHVGSVFVAFIDWSRRYTIASGKEGHLIRVAANVDKRAPIAPFM